MAMLVPALAQSTLRVENNTFVHFPQRRKILYIALFQLTNGMKQISHVFKIHFMKNFLDVVADFSPNCTGLRREHKFRCTAKGLKKDTPIQKRILAALRSRYDDLSFEKIKFHCATSHFAGMTA